MFFLAKLLASNFTYTLKFQYINNIRHTFQTQIKEILKSHQDKHNKKFNKKKVHTTVFITFLCLLLSCCLGYLVLRLILLSTRLSTIIFILFSSCDIFQNPWNKFTNSCADTRQISFSTPYAPGNDSRKKISSIFTPDLQWATTVTLTRILSTVFMSCAKEYFWYELVTTCPQEHVLAAVVADDWH